MTYRKKARQRQRGEDGQSMAEFAIILPLLIILLAASCDIGWVTLHRIRLNELADTLAHVNQQEAAALADIDLLRYVERNYPDIDTSHLTLATTPQVARQTYYEYVWQPNIGRFHYRVPMYYKRLITTVKLRYQVSYLTPWGKLLFGTGGNEITLTAQTSAMRVLENESYRS